LFQDRKQWLSTKGRPEEVKWWNGRGKKLANIPVFTVVEFAMSWTSWWQSLQPSWRAQKSWPPSRVVPLEEDWKIFHQGGANGLFIVVMCLSWWSSRAKTAKERTSFEAAKADVAWVFEQVCASLPPVVGEKRACEGLPNEPKKRRRFDQSVLNRVCIDIIFDTIFLPLICSYVLPLCLRFTPIHLEPSF
jgi:hypothetical protein